MPELPVVERTPRNPHALPVPDHTTPGATYGSWCLNVIENEPRAEELRRLLREQAADSGVTDPRMWDRPCSEEEMRQMDSSSRQTWREGMRLFCWRGKRDA